MQQDSKVNKAGSFAPYLASVGAPVVFIKANVKPNSIMMIAKFTQDTELAARYDTFESAHQACESLGIHWKVYEIKENLKKELHLLKWT